ncbi:unnamed protein product, partial [Rotaria magnacalcarata]
MSDPLFAQYLREF